MRGLIIYRGPSMLDGSPIVAVATGLSKPSTNTKTGHMVQIYIMRADLHPIEAANTGADAGICGDCSFRPSADAVCHVVLLHGPSNVWKGLQNAGYYSTLPTLEDVSEALAGRDVRLGFYGDPAAVPMAVWMAVLARVASHTAYTHQWRSKPALAAICMASVASEAERLEARALGFRTFRVRGLTDAPVKGEGQCPASHEMGAVTTCAACGLCNGHASGRKSDITIKVHGSGKPKAFESARAA